MLIEAEYDHGQIKLARLIRVAHERFLVQVEIPDAEILHELAIPSIPATDEKVPSPLSPGAQIKPSDRLRAILAGHRPYPAVRQDYLDYLESQHQ